MASTVMVVGPELGREEGPGVVRRLRRLMRSTDIAVVVSFNWRLVQIIDGLLSSQAIDVPVCYFYDCVPVQELVAPTDNVWKLARNWYRTPGMAAYQDKYSVDGCHWGWLAESLVADLVARQIRHIESAFKLVSHFDDHRFVVFASDTDFLRAFRALAAEKLDALECVGGCLPGHPRGRVVSSRRLGDRVYRLVRGLLAELGARAQRHYHSLLGRRSASSGGPRLWIQWHRNTRPLFESSLIRSRYQVVGWQTPARLLKDGVVDGASILWRIRHSTVKHWNHLFGRVSCLDDEEVETLSRVFSHRGVSFFERIRPVFEASIARQVASLRSVSEGIAGSLDGTASLVITAGYSSPTQKLAFHHARRFGIPSVAVQHGLKRRNKLSEDIICSDWFGSWGPQAEEEYSAVSAGNEGRVKVLGSFLHDQLKDEGNGGTTSSRDVSRLPIPPGARVVSFYPPTDRAVWSPGAPYDAVERTTLAVVETLGSLTDLFVIIKPHPLARRDLERMIPARLRCVVRVLDDWSPYALLRCSDLAVIENSTIGLDALCVGTPAVAVDFYGWPPSYRLPYRGYDLIPIVRTPDELGATVESLLRDQERTQELLRNRDRFFSDYLVWDGLSEERLVEFVEELSARGGRTG